MSRTAIVALVLVLSVSSRAFPQSPEEAQKELQRLNIPYTSEEFIRRARQGDEAAVDLFLDAGIDPDIRDKHGRTALVLATREGNMDVIKTLLDKGADIDARKEGGWTSLTWAASEGYFEVVQLLLESGADVDAEDKSGATVLMRAASLGHTEIVTALLDKGADPNKQDSEGWTPLMFAAFRGYSGTVRILLEKGALPDLESTTGETAISSAALHSHDDIVRMLEKRIKEEASPVRHGNFEETQPRAPAPVNAYPWMETYDESRAIASRISVPDGYERIGAAEGSFERWLRYLPLKEGRPPVYLYDGRSKGNQNAHFAVVDIDVGKRDLQQCADAIMRLRAEYFYSLGRFEAIHFNFTSGDRADFTKWAAGYRPDVDGNDVSWVQSEGEDSSYNIFRAYLTRVFTYAGSYSLSREMHRVEDVSEMKIGDVFIQGGFPGHAIIVVDMAVNKATGKGLFLLAQSYMPAQDIHLLKNPENDTLDPWYELEFGDTLNTPKWTFSRDDLKRF